MAKSKSAYSIPGKQGKLDTHIIVVWVDNETGVLARVVGLFSGRGYNIESLAVKEGLKLSNSDFILLNHADQQFDAYSFFINNLY